MDCAEAEALLGTARRGNPEPERSFGSGSIGAPESERQSRVG